MGTHWVPNWPVHYLDPVLVLDLDIHGYPSTDQYTNYSILTCLYRLEVIAVLVFVWHLGTHSMCNPPNGYPSKTKSIHGAPWVDIQWIRGGYSSAYTGFNSMELLY